MSNSIQTLNVSSLARLRKIRKVFYISIFMYLPIMFLIANITKSGLTTLIAFLASMFYLVKLGWQISTFKCPKCGEYYHWKDINKWWARHCVHCGLYIKADIN